jgi:hypothetical protein
MKKQILRLLQLVLLAMLLVLFPLLFPRYPAPLENVRFMREAAIHANEIRDDDAFLFDDQIENERTFCEWPMLNISM